MNGGFDVFIYGGIYRGGDTRPETGRHARCSERNLNAHANLLPIDPESRGK